MARPAAAKPEDPQCAALEARVKTLFDAVKREPVPARLLRHVEALEANGKNRKR